ncbi:MAG: 3-coathanger stack domain-containing protein, partial [Leadbetterella sp.]
SWSKNNINTAQYEIISGETNPNISISSEGSYKLNITDSYCGTVSNFYTIFSGSTSTLTNSYGNIEQVNISPGQTENLVINFTGIGPWNYILYDHVNLYLKTSINAQTILPVSPSASRKYFLLSVSGSEGCENGSTFGGVTVNVTPTILTYDTPTMTSVCPGGIITIPYTLSGNVGTNRDLNVQMQTNSGSLVSSSYLERFSTNPIYYQVPNSVSPGTYKFSINSRVPYINNFITSPYTFQVVNNNCPNMPQASVQSFDSTCKSIYLKAVPNGNGYTYQWYKDDIAISGATSDFYTTYSSGNYKVRVINSSTSYNSTSNNKNVYITFGNLVLSSLNKSICGTYTTTSINSSIINPNINYTWSKRNTSTNLYETISGETNPNITVSSAGDYRLTITDPFCGTESSSYTIYSGSTATLNTSYENVNAITIFPYQTLNLVINFTGMGPWNYTLSDGVNTFAKTSSNSQVILPVSPQSSRLYYLNSVSGSGSCSSGSVLGSVVVNVLNYPVFTYDTPTMTHVCPGGVITIPYTLSGQIGTNRNITVNLQQLNGSSAGSFSGFSSNPIMYPIPYTIAPGTYKFSTSLNVPYSTNTVASPYSFVVSTANCPVLPQASIQSLDSTCNSIKMKAIPNGTEFSYEWYRDNVLINDAKSSSYIATTTGSYKVKITSLALSYSSISLEKSVQINVGDPILSSSNRSICGSLTSSTISSSIINPNLTYTWSKLDTLSKIYQDLIEEVSPFLNVQSEGDYRLILSDGYCSTEAKYKIYGTSSAILRTSKSENFVFLYQNQTENLIVDFSGLGPWSYVISKGSDSLIGISNSNRIVIPFVAPPVGPQGISYYFNMKKVTGAGGCELGATSGTTTIFVSSSQPCLSNLALIDGLDNYSGGIITKQAKSITGIIIGKNKISGTANVTYQAGKSLTFEPGFVVESGAVFKTEFGGCN